MSAGLERLKSEAAGLTAQERAELAQFLIQSLDPDDTADEEEVAASWEAELARRVEEIDNGTEPGIPAEQVFSELREKYQ
jgi:putative addiction module component (TIGR02574 family)